MTKVFNKKTAKRAVSVVLLLLIVFSSIFVLPITAAAKSYTISFDYCYDTSNNIIKFVKKTSNDGYVVGEVGEELCRIKADGKDAYCIQPGHTLKSGNTLTEDASAAWKGMSDAQRKAINLALLFGKSKNKAGLTGTDGQQWIATQMFVWEFATGCRATSGEYKRSSAKYFNGICSGDKNPGVKNDYNKIAKAFKNYEKIPSFAFDTNAKAKNNVYDLKYKSGNYTLTITDSNKVLSEFDFKKTDGVSVSVSGNKITITSSKAIKTPVVFSADRDMPNVSDTLVACGDTSLQDIVTGVKPASNPPTAYFAVESSAGNLKLVKTSEDGKVSGISFKVTGDGNYKKTVKTDAKGEFLLEDLTPGTYTVTETTADRYETQKSQTVKVESGKTATVKFSNVLKRGSLKVVKTSEDNLVSGVKFHLYGKSLSGAKVDEYATTDSKGVAEFKNILVSGSTNYTLEEVDTAIRYVVPKSQAAAIEWNKVTNKSFENVLKKFKLTVTKKDVEKTSAQGDATLAGATYGIYKADKLIDKYVTDDKGQFTSKEYVCDTDWTVKEIEASEGYLLNSTVYSVGADPKIYTVEHNTTSLSVTEQVIKGRISIVKHTDNGETQIETPEKDAEFEVYLKSAGSYSKAKDTEKDKLVCDENGYAQTKLLPYGTYTVHQTKSWDGRDLVADFDVYIAENEKTYNYIINNRNFESYIKIVKLDSETNKVIPYENAGFKLYDPDGKLIKMSVTYPKRVTIDTFYTNSEGYLITPEKLPYGKGYSAVEVHAPYGYVLDSTPVKFNISKENSTMENTVTVIKVNKSNVAQKGKIVVTKEGERFYDVVTSGNNPIVYQPVYKTFGAEDASYAIKAIENVITPDGTVRYKKGEIVDTIKTNSKGTATSRELYLGKYEVTEIKAPYGLVLDTKPHTVELTYAGQEVKVTETKISFYNERQKASVSLKKVLEQNELFGIGNNKEIANITFGLYAAEDIKTVNSPYIPADALIEIISVDENGNAAAQADLPFGKYYIKEISTDEHYILSDEKYKFEFSYQGEEIPTVEIAVNDGEPINNEMIYGSVSGKKTDDKGIALGGATIGLFKTEDAAEPLMTDISAEDGSFKFEKIPYGTWYIREIAQPTGYVLNSDTYPVTISENEQVIDITIENKIIRGKIELTKVDEDYPENKLSGATFILTEDSNDNGKLDKDDKQLGKIKEQSKGIYSTDDLEYGRYFVQEQKAPKGFELDKGIYTVNIETDGKTYEVENKAGVGFINKAMKGTLKIVKTSSDKNVKGFSFRITGDDYDRTFKTDKNGVILIKNLRIGEYIVSEVKNKASKSYILPENKTAVIKHKAVTIVKMHNKKRTTPKTGEEYSVDKWIGLGVTCAVVLAGLGVSAYLTRKRKKKEDKKE